MMNAIADTTRRQLGELGSMSKQTEVMERRILSIAQERLASLEPQLAPARLAAMAGDDNAKDRYTELVAERGRLEQVISRARAELGV